MSAPNNSNANASHDTGAHCNHTRSAPKSTYDWETSVPTIDRCDDTTPLGTPVEPEVNITHTASPGTTRRPTGTCGAGCGWIAPPEGAIQPQPHPDARPANTLDATTNDTS